MNNYMKLELAALSENESFARSAVAAFALPLSPTFSELSDIKTAVSEAVTNCIVHAYKGAGGVITIECRIEKTLHGGILHIDVTDNGCGIEDVKLARQPLYTTDRESERSGMGFTVMESFMDKIKVTSKVGKGTSVVLYKRLISRDIT